MSQHFPQAALLIIKELLARPGEARCHLINTISHAVGIERVGIVECRGRTGQVSGQRHLPLPTFWKPDAINHTEHAGADKLRSAILPAMEKHCLVSFDDAKKGFFPPVSVECGWPRSINPAIRDSRL